MKRGQIDPPQKKLSSKSPALFKLMKKALLEKNVLSEKQIKPVLNFNSSKYYGKDCSNEIMTFSFLKTN